MDAKRQRDAAEVGWVGYRLTLATCSTSALSTMYFRLMGCWEEARLEEEVEEEGRAEAEEGRPDASGTVVELEEASMEVEEVKGRGSTVDENDEPGG